MGSAGRTGMARWFVNVGVLALMALAACTSPATSTGPPLTPEQRAKALQRAAAYCKKKGLVMRSEAPTRSAKATSEVQFRCVKAG